MSKVSEESPFPVWEHFPSIMQDNFQVYLIRGSVCYLNKSAELFHKHFACILSFALHTCQHVYIFSKLLVHGPICGSVDTLQSRASVQYLLASWSIWVMTLLPLSTKLCFISSSSLVSGINQNLNIVEEWSRANTEYLHYRGIKMKADPKSHDCGIVSITFLSCK